MKRSCSSGRYGGARKVPSVQHVLYRVRHKIRQPLHTPRVKGSLHGRQTLIHLQLTRALGAAVSGSPGYLPVDLSIECITFAHVNITRISRRKMARAVRPQRLTPWYIVYVSRRAYVVWDTCLLFLRLRLFSASSRHPPSSTTASLPLVFCCSSASPTPKVSRTPRILVLRIHGTTEGRFEKQPRYSNTARLSVRSFFAPLLRWNLPSTPHSA